MIRLLPFILIPLFVLGGLWYWRNLPSKQAQNTPSGTEIQADTGPVEVPKTVPNATVEDRVTALESAVSKLVPQVNNLKTTGSSAPSSTLDARLSAAEGAVTDLKARVSALEKGSSSTQTSSKLATVYIPLGTGGTSGDKNWINNDNYGAAIDPAEYPGYSTMQLEVNFRMTQKSGTAYARLYNVTDSGAKEQVSTTSDAFGWQTSYGFTLPAGRKTYTLQTKSTEGAEIQLQSARIKVNF